MEKWSKLSTLCKFDNRRYIKGRMDFSDRGYMVCSNGLMKNKHGKIIKGNLCTKGYMRTTIYDNDGKKHSVLIHQVVFQTFSGVEMKDGYSVDHIDRDKLNNDITNLRMTTDKEQCANQTRHLSGKYILYLENLLMENSIVFDKSFN